MGLFDSLKKIAKVALPIAGAGIANLLVPGSGFLAPAIGGGIGALFGGQKPGQALLTALAAGAGGKFLGGSKLFSGLGKFAAPVGAAVGAAPAAIAVAEQNELMKKMREMYPNADEQQLQELVLRQTVKAPTNYLGYEDMQVASELVPKARGGTMDLRQIGGMSLGPGTEKSDDIPAMLSDGEFVMTSRAVRGLGNGNRKLGAKRLYDMMHRAERNATV